MNTKLNRRLKASMLTLLAGCMIGSAMVGGGCARRAKTENALSDAILTEQAAASPKGGQVFDFFERLQQRPLVCSDDLITGVLLVKTGAAPAGGSTDGYSARLDAARELGFVAAGYNLPALSVVTTEEMASAVVSAATRDRRLAKPQDAMKVLASGSWLPTDLSGEENATGLQLLTALGGLSDLIASGGVELPTEAVAEPMTEKAGDDATGTKAFPELGLAPDEKAGTGPGAEGVSMKGEPEQKDESKVETKAETKPELKASEPEMKKAEPAPAPLPPLPPPPPPAPASGPAVEAPSVPPASPAASAPPAAKAPDRLRAPVPELKPITIVRKNPATTPAAEAAGTNPAPVPAPVSAAAPMPDPARMPAAKSEPAPLPPPPPPPPAEMPKAEPVAPLPPPPPPPPPAMEPAPTPPPAPPAAEPEKKVMPGRFIPGKKPA